MDLAGVLLLIFISFSAIMINVGDIYGDYGINEKSYTLPTLILFCIQWTLVLIPIHLLAQLPMRKLPEVKRPMLLILMVAITISSIVMILNSLEDIRDALIMDAADVSDQHYRDLETGGRRSKANYLLLLPNLLVNIPFPTFALLLWFYCKSAVKCPLLLRLGILLASIVQAVLSIISAGRSALIYWVFDFFIIYSFFYQYLSKKLKKLITIVALIIGSLIGTMFTIITIARFDVAGDKTRNPLESIYGYAGQHINNFCHMFVEGADSPFQIDRIFPFTARLTGHSFDMYEHYLKINTHVKGFSNVFDTFGAEVYLDLGWFGYLTLLMLLCGLTYYIKRKWTELTFHRLIFLSGAIAFYTHGLFAWPFTGHYTTWCLMMMVVLSYCFRYKFKL